MTWNIMMRTLQGQGPKVASILTSPYSMNIEDLKKIMNEDCNEDSDGWHMPGVETWASKAFLDNFFLRPADPEAYKR
jgi:ribose transport system substrate-binding protein